MHILLCVVLLFGVLLSQDRAIAADSTNATKHLVVVSQAWGTNKDGFPAVSGIVSNITDKALGHVMIKAKFYDASGSVVANRPAFVSGLGPHETWKFSVSGPENAKSYRLDDPLWKP